MADRGRFGVWVAASIVVLGLSGLRAVGAAGPADYVKMVPAGHEVFLYFDFAQARSSKLYADLKPKAIDQQASAGLAAIEQLVGIRLLDDIDVVAASGKLSPNNEGCLYLKGRWDQQRIQSLLATNPSYTEIPKPGGKMLGWLDNKKGTMTYGAFLGNNMLVVGEKTGVEACLDAPAAQGSAFADNPAVKAYLADNATANPLAAVVAVRPKTLPPTLAGKPVIQNLQSASLALLQDPVNLTLVVRAEADSPQMASKWNDIVRGAIALGQIQDQIPKIAEIAGQATAALRGSVVELRAQMKTAEATAFLGQKIDERRANQPNMGGMRLRQGTGPKAPGEKPVPAMW
jgi:hypothetical protein